MYKNVEIKLYFYLCMPEAYNLDVIYANNILRIKE